MTTSYHIEETINAPAEKVWSLLGDSSTWTDWNPTIVSIEGPIAVGQKVKLVSTLNPKRTFNLSVTDLVPNQRMVWSDGMPLGLFTGERTYTLTETDGATTFAMTEEYTGLLAGMITKSIPDMTDSFAEFAAGLKDAAEH